MLACGGDDDDDDDTTSGGGSSGSGGSDSGGSSGSGGKSGSGGGAGTGGNAGSGGSGGAPACDLSGEGKTAEDVPLLIEEPLTLTSDTVWTLNGTVEVRAGGVLTIEPCTRIEGTQSPVGALFIERGGQIMAEGTADEPILFTSAGDRVTGGWGGVVLLGNAQRAGGGESGFEGTTDRPEFRYGGTDDADNSGIMRYVRIEFSGYEFLPDKEINGLSMAGVGSGTQIDHIMVSNTQDDCFEWWGGTVEANFLICNNAGDDMFDVDEGYRGSNSTWFGRLTATANSSSDNPNGFEWDSINAGDMPATDANVSNVTLCSVSEAGFAVDPNYGMVLRERITGGIDNLVLAGFEFGVDTRDNFLVADPDPNVTIINSLIFGTVANAAETDNDMGFDETAWFTAGMGNTNPDTEPFPLADCLAAAGPGESVTGSGTGAFADGAEWMTGLWVDWSEE